MSSTKIIAAVVVVVLAVVGITAVAMNNNKSSVVEKVMSKSSEVLAKKDDAMKKTEMMKKDGEAMMKADGTKMTAAEMEAMKMEKDKMMKDGVTADSAMKKDDVTTDSMMKKDDKMMSKSGYVAYSAEAIAANSAGTNIIFFHAPWCPSCKSIDADITANLSVLPANFQILKADFDTSTALKQKYGVTQQSTFVKVDKDGNKVGTASTQFNLKTIADIVAFGQK